ncbi:CBS domain-containing protein [Flexivirga sp. ID2601S]|uniref:CBS domain-containing protein n=1 Tax=Flexivirga aerilata TaxID=1656889 RepID=A0A849AE20_9MICO|nr:CBS domain-containing protein [Flexivirga aerilata]NNG37816.1 CBS domain-containing protein [Flexivirga aerilata]
MRIQELIKGKGPEVVTVPATTTVRQLVQTLADHGIGAVVVMDDGAISGIISERDVVRALPEQSEHSARSGDSGDLEGLLERPVSELMTTTVHTCGPDDEIRSLAGLMTEHRIRHLPVVQDDQLVGIVSIGDIVKFRLQELQDERDQLESYITT